MPKPTHEVTRTIRSEQVLNAFIKVVRPNLPLDLQNTRITAEEMLYALAYADVHRLSIASTCQELRDAPSGNRLREVLVEALPDRAGVQRALNRIFHQQLHPSLLKGKRAYNIAIDLTLIPYHGQPYQDKKEIVRGCTKIWNDPFFMAMQRFRSCMTIGGLWWRCASLNTVKRWRISSAG